MMLSRAQLHQQPGRTFLSSLTLNILQTQSALPISTEQASADPEWLSTVPVGGSLAYIRLTDLIERQLVLPLQELEVCFWDHEVMVLLHLADAACTYHILN